MALICDTGVLYAAANTDDANHEACASLLAARGHEAAVPAPVLVELDWLICSRMGFDAFDHVLQSVEIGALDVLDLTVGDYARVQELCRRYDDLGLGFVDASVIAIAERLGEREIATLDRRHFGTVRPRHVDSFTLLP